MMMMKPVALGQHLQLFALTLVTTTVLKEADQLQPPATIQASSGVKRALPGEAGSGDPAHYCSNPAVEPWYYWMGDVCESDMQSWQFGRDGKAPEVSARDWVRICPPEGEGPMTLNRNLYNSCPKDSRCKATDPFEHPLRPGLMIRSIWCEQLRKTPEGNVYYLREWKSVASTSAAVSDVEDEGAGAVSDETRIKDLEKMPNAQSDAGTAAMSGFVPKLAHEGNTKVE